MTGARTAQRFRRAWYWLVVLGVAVVAATLLCVRVVQSRIAQNDQQFRTAQMLRLARVRTRIDDLFGDAVQLASSGASIWSRIPLQRPLIGRVTRELYASALDPAIYGAGPFFAPGVFGPNQLVSVYVRRVDPSVPHSAQDHPFSRGVEVDYSASLGSASVRYTSQAWYRAAVTRIGHTVIWGPYPDEQRSFISVLRAFDRHGRVAGVMSVDILKNDFLRIMGGGLIAGDVVSIVAPSAHRVMLATASHRARDQIALQSSIRFAPHAVLELSSDAAALHLENRRLWIETALLILAIWGVAAILTIGLLQRWRSRERESIVAAERERLERELAIGRSVEEQLRVAAFTDSLTGLPNRAAFMAHARAALADRAARGAVFFIDLDRFNIVNETMGHLAGDELLRTVGARLRAVSSAGDMMARLGGDEFVIFAAIDASRDVADLAQTLLAHLGEPIVINGRSLYPEASIGIVRFDGYASAEDVLRDADIAMYEAKRGGRSQYVLFDEAMRARVARDSELESALRRAIERGELVPHYQPLIDVQTGGVAGFEALVRWERGGEFVPAREFMPFAESHGLVAAIDVAVLGYVHRHRRAIFDLFPAAKIAVNVSAAELAAPGLVETIARMRDECEVRDRLELEITETTMMTSSESAKRTIDRLREMGVNVVLDDFGTGYSSLAYLQRLPIAGLKIDRTFIEPIETDPRAVEIVRSIVLMARSFGLSVTAEGVEREGQFALLRELGIDYAQGFFFSPALDIASLVRFQAQSIWARHAVE